MNTKQIRRSIPKDYPVKPILVGSNAARLLGNRLMICGACGLGWDDDKSTSMTPAPSARCPFEVWHVDESEELDEREAREQINRTALDLLRACKVALVLCNSLDLGGDEIAFDGRDDFSVGQLLRQTIAKAEGRL